MTEIKITNTRPEHIPQLVMHQRVCFPTLAEHELLKQEHFESHVRLFPEGQHVVLDGERVVGQSSTLRVSEAFAFEHTTFHEIIADGFFTTHDPDGAWLYGADVSVNPDYRGRGLSRKLYDARKELIRQLNLRGMVAGGMIPGYHLHRATMSVEDYVNAVASGAMTDPTLTPQMRSGFVPRGVLHDYIEAGELGNDSVLIVWENVEFST